MLTDRRPRVRVRRRLWLRVVVGVVLAAALVPFGWVQAVGQAAVVPDPADAPRADAVLVLGAGLRPDGSPSTYLRRRLDAAAQLYADGVAPVVVVSGDGRDRSHDEPRAMRAWLLERGVPAEAVELDREGVDTTASCRRAHDAGYDSAVVVTQDYHLRRALFSCRAAGLDASGIGVSSASVEPLQAIVWRLREFPASLEAAWDAYVGDAATSAD